MNFTTEQLNWLKKYGHTEIRERPHQDYTVIRKLVEDIEELTASRDSCQLSAVPSDVDKGLGKCVEPNCGKFAQKDYNGCGHYVCDYHYDKLNREFDEEYK